MTDKPNDPILYLGHFYIGGKEFVRDFTKSDCDDAVKVYEDNVGEKIPVEDALAEMVQYGVSEDDIVKVKTGWPIGRDAYLNLRQVDWFYFHPYSAGSDKPVEGLKGSNPGLAKGTDVPNL